MASVAWGVAAIWLAVGAMALYEAEVKADKACPDWKICIAGLAFAAAWPIRALRRAARLFA